MCGKWVSFLDEGLYMTFSFSGEMVTHGNRRDLVHPYKIAYSIYVQDKTGKEYSSEEVAEHIAEASSPIISGPWDRGSGWLTCNVKLKLPIKPTDASILRIRFSKVSSG